MDVQTKLVVKPKVVKKRILFLGKSRAQTSLIDELANSDCEIWHTQGIRKKK